MSPARPAGVTARLPGGQDDGHTPDAAQSGHPETHLLH